MKVNQTVKHIRRNLLQLRDRYGLSDASWARLAEVNRSDLSRFTNGHIQNPSFDFLEKLCAAVGVTLYEVMGDMPMPGNDYTTKERDHIMRLRLMDADLRGLIEKLVAAFPR